VHLTELLDAGKNRNITGITALIQERTVSKGMFDKI
jgi:hypothetical protein